MKKTFYLLSLTFILCLASLAASAATSIGGTPTKAEIAAMTPEERQARVEEIKTRIAEIKAEDRSQMSKDERKAYRAELKALKKEASMYDVLYIGVGALVILILILLIVL
jgi:hypothetical protein